jgi:hypothetical protein
VCVDHHVVREGSADGEFIDEEVEVDFEDRAGISGEKVFLHHLRLFHRSRVCEELIGHNEMRGISVTPGGNAVTSMLRYSDTLHRCPCHCWLISTDGGNMSSCADGVWH